MIVICDQKILETQETYIRCGEHLIDVFENEYEKKLEMIVDYMGFDKASLVQIDLKPKNYLLTDSLVLLAIGIYHRGVKCYHDGIFYEITFSHNFPICLERNLLKPILDNFGIIAKSQLIALGEEGDFIRVDVSDDKMYDSFYKRRGCLIRRNDKELYKDSTYSLNSVLRNWHSYCKKKFNVDYPIYRLEAYERMYSLSGFSTETYLLNNQIVAQGVVYKSEYSKTMYYCIFAWDEKFKNKSPGKYVYCKMIQKCHEIGYHFSFCYGLQNYKLNLLKDFYIGASI